MEIDPKLITIKQITVPPLDSIPTLHSKPTQQPIKLKAELISKLEPKTSDTNLTCVDYFWYSFKTKRD